MGYICLSVGYQYWYSYLLILILISIYLIGWTEITDISADTDTYWLSVRPLISGNNIYGVGTDKRIYKNTALRGRSAWYCITTGSVTSLDYYGGYLYGVGTDRAVWRTRPNGRWTRVTTGSVTMIKVDNKYLFY